MEYFICDSLIRTERGLILDRNFWWRW